MPTATERHRELCNDYPAVSTYWLPGTTLASVVARDHAGAIAVAELVGADATLARAAAIEELARTRQQANRALDLATDNLVAHLVAGRAAGVKPAELAELAGRAGIGRSTVYYLLQNAPAAAAA
jgi:DNA-binding IclR family transcriptional regulator